MTRKLIMKTQCDDYRCMMQFLIDEVIEADEIGTS